MTRRKQKKRAGPMHAYQISSGYGGNTGRPFVEVRGPTKATISPQEARALGLELMRAAEAAESDGFFVEYFAGRLGMEMKEAAGLLFDFREWRYALWREKYGLDVTEVDDGQSNNG